MLVSVLGLLIVRRFVNIDWLKKHHDIASYFFLMIGTLYAVLIAFAIFVVWTQFQDAGTNLEREVNAVGDLSRMSAGLPEPQHTHDSQCLAGVHSRGDRRRIPGHGRRPRQSAHLGCGAEAHGRLHQCTHLQYEGRRSIRAESLKHLNDLSNYRRIRLFTSRGTVPPLLWYLLFWGGSC